MPWERMRRNLISFEIGDVIGEDPRQFNQPHGTLMLAGTLFVADTYNHRIHSIATRTNTHNSLQRALLPSSLSKESSERIVACCRNRTALDLSLSTDTVIKRRLEGDWEGKAESAAVHSGTLIVLTRRRRAAMIHLFSRNQVGDWQQQPGAIALPENSSASQSFTSDPNRVWWCWQNNQQSFFGCWDLTGLLPPHGRQLIQRTIDVCVKQMAERLDGRGCILAVDEWQQCAYRISMDGVIMEQFNPGLGFLFSIGTARDGTIILTTGSRVMMF